MWTLANYLLLKGNHTFINLEVSQGAEWFPEYDLPIGHPITPLPAVVDVLRDSSGLYVRVYSNGLVLVNADPDGAPLTMSLSGPMQLVTGAVGGGDVPEDGDTSGWHIQTAEVTEVTVSPGQAAILLGSFEQPAAHFEQAEPTPVPAATNPPAH